MYKTIWIIKNLTENTTTKLTWYHFGKKPRFPTWYMKEKETYEIEIIENLKLLHTFKIFFKCLTHFYKIK